VQLANVALTHIVAIDRINAFFIRTSVVVVDLVVWAAGVTASAAESGHSES
jgi:hypothetical protein